MGLQNSILQLDYIINVNNFQKIQDAMAEATEMALLTVDYIGNPVTTHSRCSEFCSAIRANPEYSKQCNKCDSRGGLEATRLKQPYIYICHVGILDFAVPIIVNGHYIGAVMAGQVRVADDELDTLERIVSDKHSNDKAKLEFEQLYNKLPRMTLDRVKAIANMVFQLSNYIVEEALLKINLSDVNQKVLALNKQGVFADLPNTSADNETHKYYEVDSRVQTEKMEDVPQNEDKHKVVKMLYKDNIILKPALEYIQENFHTTISLDEMASKCNISTSYFSKLFKKAKGENFANYINKVRIKKAKEYLETTDMPILNIAFELGFEDCGYFIKVFKKQEGMTPAVYRNEYNRNS